MLQDHIVLPEDLFVDVDRGGPVPLYFQVSSCIEQAILTGHLPAGARLENEMVLGRRLGLSRPTIRHAIQELVDKGLLVKSRGIGTQVVHGQLTRDVALSSLFEDLSRIGKRPSSSVLTHELVTAPPHVAAALDTETGAKVFHLRRVRLAGGVPFAILENYLPERFAALSPGQLEQGSLYRMMRARGATMRVAKQNIGARTAEPDEERLLDMPPGAPVLTVNRRVYDSLGKAVDIGRHSYRPDLYSFDITLVDK
ncbi:GntR family transcriptional regulator [Pseudarthrobacter cellobiosi]|uniref:GntR family transcriptional regulator n=1 Tax=Pseudarthrobacter cellobiosi TaxID=2953654 RepID=UPI00208F80E8|nr:GntR family transcriptional regulator [Pseudarthrobacter sp. HLT1-5]MCO4256384.1 GntR family transcriptional regulator [Pseudarthrobacter sp. HLT1-5]